MVTPELARTAKDDIFEPDMVMAVTAFVWGEGVGAAYGQEPLVITESGAELLVGSPFTGPGPG